MACFFPLLTVVIPVYNAERTITQAVDSIISQPNADKVELLLVDDGSIDRGPSICDELAKAHPNVKVLHKENGGVSSARNMGIDNASGKYLAFLDSDDWWEKDFLTDDLITDFNSLESPDLYCFSYQKVSPSRRWVKPRRITNKNYKYDEPNYAHSIGQHHSAFLYKREYLNKMGFRYLQTKIWEDVPFTQLCCTFAKSIVCIDKVIFSYWMNYNSVMHTKSGEELFMEHYKAEHIAQSVYNANGLTYDIDRIIISLIGECLKYISEENTFGHVKKLIAKDEFYLLNHSEVQPWQYLQNDIALWREKPFFAWIKNKLKRAPLHFIKRTLLASQFTRPIAEYIQYRVIEKWKPYTILYK